MATMKYVPYQHSDGKWYVSCKGRFFNVPASVTKKECIYWCLTTEGHEYNNKLEKIQQALEDGGYVSYSDPYGWRA